MAHDDGRPGSDTKAQPASVCGPKTKYSFHHRRTNGNRGQDRCSQTICRRTMALRTGHTGAADPESEHAGRAVRSRRVERAVNAERQPARSDSCAGCASGTHHRKRGLRNSRGVKRHCNETGPAPATGRQRHRRPTKRVAHGDAASSPQAGVLRNSGRGTQATTPPARSHATTFHKHDIYRGLSGNLPVQSRRRARVMDRTPYGPRGPCHTASSQATNSYALGSSHKASMLAWLAGC